MEVQEEVEDVQEESLKLVRGLLDSELSWPGVSQQPVPIRSKGRFVKSHPLEFPMGVADLDDERYWEVSLSLIHI